MSNIPRFIRLAVGWPLLQFRMRTWYKFMKATHDPQAAQERKLQQILQEIAGSAMAAAMGLRPDMSIEEFRNSTEIAGYDRMQPWIDKVFQGDTTAMFSPASKIMMFAMTSGTTAGCKHIPVTRTSFEEYRRSWTVWGCATARKWKEFPYGGVLNFASTPEIDHSPAGIPTGSISGMLFRAMHYTMRYTHAVPPFVSEVKDTDLRIYLTLRLALNRQDTRMLTTANPSTLISVAKKLELWKEDLIRDLFDGTLRNPGAYSKEIFRQSEPMIRQRNITLATRLETMAAPTLTPAIAWPRLQLLGIWTGGTLSSYLPEIRRLYGENIALRDHGLSASESRMTIPLEDHTASGALNIDGGFFEFIPVAEYDRGNRQTKMAWELTTGTDYYIILSTNGGLIRYDIHDVVRCTGYLNKTPLLAFLNKGSQIGNLTGEKLSAWQASTAVREFTEQQNHPHFDYIIAPRFSTTPGYVVILELRDRNALKSDADFAKFLDRRWMELNMEYQDKRASGRLAAPVVMTVRNGYFDQLRLAKIAKQGGTFEQYKHPFFTTDSSIVRDAELDDTRTGEERCC